MLLEYAEACFECMEHRFRHLRGLACVMRVLQEYALANDMGLQFDDVPVGLVKLSRSMRDSWICADSRHSSDLNRRTATTGPFRVMAGPPKGVGAAKLPKF